MVTVSALICIGLYRLSTAHQFQFFGELFYRGNTSEKVVALTFDDGPVPRRTQKILALLQRNSVKATFYLNGNKLEAHPEAAKSLIAAGHEIGNHGYSHKRMVFMPYSEVGDEIESTTQLIRDYGYDKEIHFRPPYGKNLFVLPYYLKNNNITTVTWDVESETFEAGKDTPELITNRAVDGVKPGSIVLLHVMYGDGSSLKAVTPIIEQLRAKGYRFVTVSEMMNLSEPKR